MAAAAAFIAKNIGAIFIGGMVLGSGVAGYNNAGNSCNAVKSAVETLKEAHKAKTSWDNALLESGKLNENLFRNVTANYTNIATQQQEIKKAQSHSKVTKIIVISLGLSVIVVLFFSLLYRYYTRRLNDVRKSMTHHRNTIHSL